MYYTILIHSLQALSMNLNQKYQEKDSVPYSSAVISSIVTEVLSIAERKLNKKKGNLTILDVGSGHGDYTKEFAKFVKKIVGVEPYYSGYISSVKSQKNKNISYYNTLIEDFNTTEKFDVVVSLTTLEHMPDAEKSFVKIYKLMKNNSVLYLTAPNKLWPYDNHYRLPFITWLPLPIANFYMRLMRRGNSYQDCSYSKTYFGLISLLKKFNWRFEFILPKHDAAYLGCRRKPSLFPYEAVKTLGIALIKRFPCFWIISKGFIVMAHKTKQK